MYNAQFVSKYNRFLYGRHFHNSLLISKGVIVRVNELMHQCPDNMSVELLTRLTECKQH